jgi:hypothetical protein
VRESRGRARRDWSWLQPNQKKFTLHSATCICIVELREAVTLSRIFSQSVIICGFSTFEKRSCDERYEPKNDGGCGQNPLVIYDLILILILIYIKINSLFFLSLIDNFVSTLQQSFVGAITSL